MIVIVGMLIGTLLYAFCQGALIRSFRKAYAQPLPSWPADQPWPKAAIVLSLRGNDPFLKNCLRNLIKQDYPEFMLQIVIDSADDPAWGAIHAIKKEFGEDSLHVSVLNDPRTSCSLKNSSIIQAINQLPADCEVVAFVDADAITHSTWLRDLVTPLADPEVGASTGVRWFAPTELNFATRLRCYWNTLATPVMYFSSTPWGGSLLVRRSVLESGLLTEWAKMLCEDVHTVRFLQRHGLKLAYVPKVTVVNREDITLLGCFRFTSRQMLFFRLYHEKWRYLVALISYAVVIAVIHYFYLVESLLHGEWLMALALLAIRRTIYLVVKWQARQLDEAVRKVVTQNGQPISKNPSFTPAEYVCTELLYLASLFSVFAPRSLNWRGIKYKINGPSDIKLLAYSPFFEPQAPAGSEQLTVL